MIGVGTLIGTAATHAMKSPDVGDNRVKLYKNFIVLCLEKIKLNKNFLVLYFEKK